MEKHLVLTEIREINVENLIDEKEYFIIETEAGLCVSDGYFIKHHGSEVSHVYLRADIECLEFAEWVLDMQVIRAVDVKGNRLLYSEVLQKSFTTTELMDVFLKDKTQQ